jgi:hypothetical protein
MEQLEGLLKLIWNEIEAINKNGKFKSREEIDSVYKLVDIVKDSMEIFCMEDDMNGDSYDDGTSYERGRRGYDGMSYARGRRNARRDERGRYSRDGYMDSYNDGRSMRGYSRADSKEDYKNQLRIMMEDAPDENTRQNIKRMIDNM